MDFATKLFLKQSIERLNLKEAFEGDVCEIGSLQVNGEVRGMFESAKSYLGVDIDEFGRCPLYGRRATRQSAFLSPVTGR